MNSQQLSAVLLKLLGIFCIIKIIEMSGSLIMLITFELMDSNNSMSLDLSELLYLSIQYAAMMIPFIATATILIKYTEGISRWLLAKSESGLEKGLQENREINPTIEGDPFSASDSADNSETSRDSMYEWYRLGLCLMGIALLIWYLPTNLVYIASTYFLQLRGELDEISQQMRSSLYSGFFLAVAQLILALLLILGNRGIINLIYKLRRGDRYQVQE